MRVPAQRPRPTTTLRPDPGVLDASPLSTLREQCRDVIMLVTVGRTARLKLIREAVSSKTEAPRIKTKTLGEILSSDTHSY